MNILLGVYACEPNKGSEPEVGWQMVNEIAKAMPNDMIYAITKSNNKVAIEQEKYPDNLIFFYYTPPKWLTFWKKGGRGIRTYYYIWMIGASLYMKRQKKIFDVVHHITFVNDWLPSFFSLLKKKDNIFIWGPIGSHDPIKKKFLHGRKRHYIEKIRIFLQCFFRNLDPIFYYCKIKADCIIGINENVFHKLKLKKGKYFITEPAIGMKKKFVEAKQIEEKKSDTFTLISVGRLIYIKNFRLTILSFAKFLENNPNLTNVQLQIIGDGEDRKSLEKLVEKLKIDKYVEFLGKVTRQEVLEQFSKVDLFLFPTLESAGFVILEAMSYALPIIAMDYGGPQQFILNYNKEQLVSSTQSYEEIINALALNIERLYKNKDLCSNIGHQNRQDVIDNFTWEAKTKRIKKLYLEFMMKENKNENTTNS